jgi:secondary thiamine-phosphate synthase enzyme
MQKIISVRTSGKGLYEITDDVASTVYELTDNDASGKESHLCCVFIQHTSASLVIQENADPSVKNDLENWFSRLVKEGDSLYTHTYEGADDMPAHIRSALTNTSLIIPVMHGRLALGTWQGIFVWEHRRSSHTRKVVVQLV